MLRLIQMLFLVFFVLLIIACNKPTEPIISDDNNHEPIVTDYRNFQFTITDFTEVIFKNNDNLISENKDVEKVSIGFMLTEVDFGELTSVAPAYTQVDSGYRLDFELTINEEYYINAKDYSLRYYFVDDSFVPVDTTVDFSKYPYGDRVLFLNYDDIGLLEIYGQQSNWSFLSDFDIMDNNVYFSPDGGYSGIYRYNYLTGETEHIVDNNGSSFKTGKETNSSIHPFGQHLAITKDYIFFDAQGNIFRYNISVDSIDVKLDYTPLEIYESPYPIGMSTGMNMLFIFFVYADNGNNGYLLSRFTYDGIFIDTIKIHTGSWNIDYYNGILYFWDNDEILRLNLENLSFENNAIAPAPIINDGFDIMDGNFYYGDESSRSIYVLPLDSLREIE